jgi:DNA-binding CsgD family transcriptional regulator
LRGIPNNPVVCIRCGRNNGAPSDRLCHGCRIKARPNPTRRFWWNPELDRQLRAVYQEAHTRRELTEGLNTFQRQSGFTRVVVLARATQLGLSSDTRRWTPAEIEVLGDLAGTLSKSAIARKLGRSYWSVKAQCSRLCIQSRIISGYSRVDVQYLLGVGPRSTTKWIKLGWLKLHNDRITEASMVKFLREHPEEYRLSRVDETWFKGLLFPSFGRNHMPGSVPARSRQPVSINAA